MLLWRHEYPELAGTPTSRLRLQGNMALQRAIAYTFQWQTLQVVQNAWVRGSPNQLLQFLINALRRRGGELYTMAIFKPGFEGGHAITPYAVDSRGGGQYDVLVYDNNWPDQVRRVRIDTRANTWSYVAAVNPSVPGAVYRGNRRTGTLNLIPLTPGLGVHFCPFCAATVSGRASYSEIWLQGNPVNHGHLLIHNLKAEQQEIGYDHGQFVSRFPGARANFPTSFTNLNQKPTPHYILPPNGDEDVTLDGYGLKFPDTETFTLIGQKHYVGIDRIQVAPNAKERILLKVSDESLTYFPDPSQTTSPVFSIGLVGAPGNFTIVVSAQSLHRDSVIRMQDVLANTMPHGSTDSAAAIQAIHDSSASGQTFEIQMTRQVAGKVEKLSDISVYQPPGKTVNLYYEQSNNGQPVVTVN
jgi:hypothetical protein